MRPTHPCDEDIKRELRRKGLSSFTSSGNDLSPWGIVGGAASKAKVKKRLRRVDVTADCALASAVDADKFFATTRPARAPRLTMEIVLLREAVKGRSYSHLEEIVGHFKVDLSAFVESAAMRAAVAPANGRGGKLAVFDQDIEFDFGGLANLTCNFILYELRFRGKTKVKFSVEGKRVAVHKRMEAGTPTADLLRGVANFATRFRLRGSPPTKCCNRLMYSVEYSAMQVFFQIHEALAAIGTLPR